jgi:hypothetical protein
MHRKHTECEIIKYLPPSCASRRQSLSIPYKLRSSTLDSTPRTKNLFYLKITSVTLQHHQYVDYLLPLWYWIQSEPRGISGARSVPELSALAVRRLFVVGVRDWLIVEKRFKQIIESSFSLNLRISVTIVNKLSTSNIYKLV